MAYQTLDSVNTSAGLHTLIIYASDTVPILMPLILFGIFVIASIGSYFASVRLNGRGDLPASFMAGSFVTVIISTVMSFVPLINISILATTYGLAIVGFLWLIFSRD